MAVRMDCYLVDHMCRLESGLAGNAKPQAPHSSTSKGGDRFAEGEGGGAFQDLGVGEGEPGVTRLGPQSLSS